MKTTKIKLLTVAQRLALETALQNNFGGEFEFHGMHPLGEYGDVEKLSKRILCDDLTEQDIRVLLCLAFLPYVLACTKTGEASRRFGKTLENALDCLRLRVDRMLDPVSLVEWHNCNIVRVYAYMKTVLCPTGSSLSVRETAIANLFRMEQADTGHIAEADRTPEARSRRAKRVEIGKLLSLVTAAPEVTKGLRIRKSLLDILYTDAASLAGATAVLDAILDAVSPLEADAEAQSTSL